MTNCKSKQSNEIYILAFVIGKIPMTDLEFQLKALASLVLTQNVSLRSSYLTRNLAKIDQPFVLASN